MCITQHLSWVRCPHYAERTFMCNDTMNPDHFGPNGRRVRNVCRTKVIGKCHPCEVYLPFIHKQFRDSNEVDWDFAVQQEGAHGPRSGFGAQSIWDDIDDKASSRMELGFEYEEDVVREIPRTRPFRDPLELPSYATAPARLYLNAELEHTGMAALPATLPQPHRQQQTGQAKAATATKNTTPRKRAAPASSSAPRAKHRFNPWSLDLQSPASQMPSTAVAATHGVSNNSSQLFPDSRVSPDSPSSVHATMAHGEENQQTKESDDIRHTPESLKQGVENVIDPIFSSPTAVPNRQEASSPETGDSWTNASEVKIEPGPDNAAPFPPQDPTVTPLLAAKQESPSDKMQPSPARSTRSTRARKPSARAAAAILARTVKSGQSRVVSDVSNPEAVAHSVRSGGATQESTADHSLLSSRSSNMTNEQSSATGRTPRCAACCRAHKKCDGAQPTCTLCFNKNKECQYLPSSVKK